MPTPDFVLALRRHIGHELLWLPGCSAIVLRGEGEHQQVLMTLRADLHVWSPVAGIVEPGEEPHETAVREAREEAGVEIEVEALVATAVTPVITYPNGDQTIYIDHTFRCRWVSGEPVVSDDESLEVRWWPVAALPEGMRPLDLARVGVALANPRPPILGRSALETFAASVDPTTNPTTVGGRR